MSQRNCCSGISIQPSRKHLKGLGHAILGNFSTDQMVIELTKIWKWRFKTIEELKQNTGKPRRGMDGQNWRGLRSRDYDLMDPLVSCWDGLHLGKFEKRRPIFFQINVILYQNIIYTAGKSFSVVMWPWFCKWKTLALPIWLLELIIDKIKQNYLK